MSASFSAFRELLANIEVGGGMQELQLLVATRVAANALLEISKLQDTVKAAPQEIKSAKYKAQMALNAMEKAALDYGGRPESAVQQIMEKRRSAHGGFMPCSDCAAPARCAERGKRCQ